jgi:hypothetical protein
LFASADADVVSTASPSNADNAIAVVLVMFNPFVFNNEKIVT